MTSHVFRGAELKDGCLCLKVENRALARRFCFEAREDKRYVAEIKEYRPKRSLDANAYCWALLGKLSAKLMIPAEEIYRELIPEVGDNFEVVTMQSDAAKAFPRIWGAGRLGWVVKELGEADRPGYVDLMCYYGSSVYNTAQMSRLIDLVVAECKEQDIETLPPEKLSLLKEAWHAEHPAGA